MEELIKGTTAYKIFCREAEAGRLAHAYMVAFEDEVYLRDALMIFALRYFGAQRESKLGGQILRGTYPDCKVYPEQGKKFNAEAAVALIEDCAMRPSAGDKKLYIISSFEECTAIVQNKLLKVIEEPPQGVAFILGATALSPVLPTILSRVRLLEIPLFSAEQIFAALERIQPGAALNRRAAESCGGVLSTAEALCRGQFSEIHSAALEILCVKNEGEAGLISQKYGGSKYKRQLLAELQRLCLAAARAGACGKADGENSTILASKGVPALLRGAEVFSSAMRDLKFNAYFTALLFSAMLTLIQENNKWQKLSV